MKENCKSSKLFLKRCEDSGVNNESVVNVPKKFVLLHKYFETGFVSIVAFSDSKTDLLDMMISLPYFSSYRHCYIITFNSIGASGDEVSAHPLFKGLTLNLVKDRALINICKNVAKYLAVGEYAMLKKFKSSAWFEKAKNSASFGAEIIDNY